MIPYGDWLFYSRIPSETGCPNNPDSRHPVAIIGDEQFLFSNNLLIEKY